jgi:hypothetical protein
LERRRADAARPDERATELRARIQELRASRLDRKAGTQDLTERFTQLLEAFGFPKLHQPSVPTINEKFVPYVRGNRYTDIGATTLISLAWQLTIFERTVEQGAPYPGFLLIHSPQTNLKPEGTHVEADEFGDPAIPRRVWEHIVKWSSGMGKSAQIVVVVDNLPPDVCDDQIVVRYSGHTGEPPYGLIDDETG